MALGQIGRLTIPASIRLALGLQEVDRLQLSAQRGAIVLIPKRSVTAEDIEGIIGPTEVIVEEI